MKILESKVVRSFDEPWNRQIVYDLEVRASVYYVDAHSKQPPEHLEVLLLPIDHRRMDSFPVM